MRGGRAHSLASSPTMVGAITTLIVIVAVFLAYNSANGLPFVPTYRISVELPNGQRLAPNNEVRVGGTRVGVIESITATENEGYPENNLPPVIAKLDLKLDKVVDPLPEDTTVKVRYKSSFGLKYLELTRGTGQPLDEGETIPVAQASQQTEFDDINNTFNEPTREAVRQNLVGYGDAFAARGASLNEVIRNLNPLFRYLDPVARVLTSKETNLEGFFPALARTAAIVAPVSDQNAEMFANMSRTFAALSADVQALQDTISSGPPTLTQGTEALATQQPFLVDFADLANRLRPGVRALRTSLPTFNNALEVGAPVLTRSIPVSGKTKLVFRQLRTLVRQPQTKTSLLRLRETFGQAAPAADWIAPSQTVCNYVSYWSTYIPNGLSQPDGIGTTFRQAVVTAPFGEIAGISTQQEGGVGGYAGVQANGRAGGLDPNPGEFKPRELAILHGPPYSPLVDSKGNADCQAGQTGYPLGDLRIPGQPASNPAIGVSNYPGNRGPTFTGRAREPFMLKPRPLP